MLAVTFHTPTNRLFVLVDRGSSPLPHLMMLSATGLELLDVVSLDVPQLGGTTHASMTVDATTNALHAVLVTSLGCMRARVPIVTHRQQPQQVDASVHHLKGHPNRLPYCAKG